VENIAINTVGSLLIDNVLAATLTSMFAEEATA